VLAATEPPLATWWAEHWPTGWSEPAAPGGRHVTPTISSEPQPARSLLLVPLSSGSPRPDWLAVSLAHRPLFPRDDRALLALLCSHSALLLEQKAMIGQLRGQNQALRLANEELEAFADSVSHDLRTPLRHIEGFAELLRDGMPGTPAQVYLERIFTATARMNHLIEVFLGFSRLGRSELAAAPVSLDALVAQVKEEVEADHSGRQIRWTIGPLPEALGDPILLRQALTNLISNAAKFTRPRALAEIEIGAQAAGAGPGQVVIFVRDNGVGFDPAYRPQLFSMFRRLHHPSEFEGDGIGLAVVRRIVERHNGRVWAEAAVEGGATFYLALPAAHEPPAANEWPAANELSAAHEPPAAPDK
jgi:light-regulated signal transduction histidine kinase (bacteriophytochrome)